MLLKMPINSTNATSIAQLSRKRCGQLARKFSQPIIGISTAFCAVLQAQIVKAQTSGGIFSGAQAAMKCIVTDASTGGVTNALFNNLPSILFTSLTLVIFGYFIYTVVQSVSSYGRGEEVTHVVQQPLFTFVFVIIIFVFQSLMFGTGQGCTTG